MAERKPVCLIIGAGAGIGGHVGKKFAAEGYHAVLCRRSDQEGLAKLVSDIEADGGEATGHLIDATDDGALEELVEAVERDIGPIEVLLFNLGAQLGNRSLEDTQHKSFELGWRLAVFALFRLAKCIVPHMKERGKGTFLVTSATAAVRGNAGQHSHAAAMGGRRMLCQTLNAELAPQGIHVCHIIIDGPVESPDTLGKLLLGKEGFEKLLEKKGNGKDELIIPAQLAETYYHMAQQHRSAWTHEIDLRTFMDKPWWNS